MSRTAEIYACLCVREFPTQALLRLRPQLRNQPCVVMEGEPPLEQVCSLTRKARILGLLPGMTQVEVDTFSGVTVLQRSRKEEITTSEALLECAGSFSPRVEAVSYRHSFVCVVDIAGTQELFGPPNKLAQNLLTRVSALGIAACVGVSSNFHASIAVARAPLALSVRVIPPGEEGAALAALPLTVLNLSEQQAETFSSWGIRNLGMLAALPERELISRLGQPGKHLRQLARGEAPHLFLPVEPEFTLHERMELDSPVAVLDALMFVANLMLEQLIVRATARVLALAAVTVALTLEGGASCLRTIRPALPTNDRPLWIKLLHLDLEAHPPQAAVLAIRLEAEPGSTSQVQMGLFSPQLPEPSRLDVTLARIRSIVGDENVGRAVVADTHRPDGFRLEPFGLDAFENSSAQSKVPSTTTLRSALRRLRPPESVSVTLQGARPEAFFFRQQRYRVEHAYGPWLTTGEWWSAASWGYEQWDLVARNPSGTTLCGCLMRDLLRNQWQMAGLYD